MRPVLVKATGENQVTLPCALMREPGRPSRFRAFATDGNLALLPACLATYDDQAKQAGIPAAVLKRAYALRTERRAERVRDAARPRRSKGAMLDYIPIKR